MGTWWVATWCKNARIHAACAVAGPPTRNRGLTAFSARAVASYLALYGPTKVALDTLARMITRRTEPHVKLH